MKEYDHTFGKASMRNLNGVKPQLVQVATRAIQLCAFDGTVVPGGGMRTQAQANANYVAGTGITNSLHIKQSDGYGHAIDLIPLTPGKGIDWSNIPAFLAMAEAVKYAAAELMIPIRQGCDWNMNGVLREAREYDLAHFEMPRPWHRSQALDLMHRYREEVGLASTPPVVDPDEEPGVCELACPACGETLILSKG